MFDLFFFFSLSEVLYALWHGAGKPKTYKNYAETEFF